MPDIATSVRSEDLEIALPNNKIVQSATGDVAPDPASRLSAAPAPIEEPRDADTPNQSSPKSAPAKPPRNASSDTSRRARNEVLSNLSPRQYHKWKSPLLMLAFYICGLGLSIAHCTFYSKLNNSIVGSSSQQRSNPRQAASPLHLLL